MNLLSIPARSGVSSSADCEEQISELESLLDSQVIFWQTLSHYCRWVAGLLALVRVVVLNVSVYCFSSCIGIYTREQGGAG